MELYGWDNHISARGLHDKPISGIGLLRPTLWPSKVQRGELLVTDNYRSRIAFFQPLGSCPKTFELYRRLDWVHMTESYLTLLLMKPEYESIILVSIAQYKFLKKTIYIYIYIYMLLSRGWRIHQLHLWRGGKKPPATSVPDMTLNNLMVRFQ